ncbi:MAG: hypothetical protein HOK30_08015 [Rhodospirillaceae bacterium]|jgi:hypothetical protein|nr:hypothetical protein [Rhodospirillaceae bacterium]MBT7760716.1 hypothetical protein [Rhodospirillaceae bacterium]
MLELGTNALKYTWFWWCHVADVIPLWNPFGAFFSVMVMVALFGMAIKHIKGKD